MRATPREIQCAESRSVGSRSDMTKLVEWPVVESVPLRAAVRTMLIGAKRICKMGGTARGQCRGEKAYSSHSG
eukprot:1661402-Pleurochrysis_carterae.AAC.3